ncbi:MAG: cyclase [Psychromonas sp.]|jgi:cyclase
MLKKRIIPCLDIKNGETVKGVNFVNLRSAGDPVELAKKYESQGADELVFLDIAATLENRGTLLDLVKKLAKELTIPFTVGGGITSVLDAQKVIEAGADKISLNSAAIKNPGLITEIANQYGNQCVVLAMDVKPVDGNWEVFTRGGTTPTGLNAIEWAKKVESLGAGEILLTSMVGDGSKAGFSIDITADISRQVKIPVIASGGAGNKDHFVDVFSKTEATAALAAGIFHFNELSIPDLKSYLKTKNISIR